MHINSKSLNNNPTNKLYKLTWLREIIFSMSLGLLFMDVWAFIFAKITQTLPVNWGVTGRWFGYVCQGTFSTPSIGCEAPIPHEWVLGVISHLLIAFFFAALYVFFIHRYFKNSSKLVIGLLLSLVFSFFPGFIELPSMGLGIMGMASTQPLTICVRTLSLHAFFGIGLGLGSMLFSYFNAKQQTTE